MRVLRLLAMTVLLASVGAAPARAQSAPPQPNRPPLATPAPPYLQPLPGSQPFSFNPSPLTAEPGGSGFNQTIPPLHLRRYNLLPSGQDPSILFQVAPLRTQRSVIVAGNEVCYTVREYKFTRDNPQSDATRRTDYYACRAAGNFHLKGVAPVLPR